ncbi:TPA: hypothetical protein ACHV24_001785 [Klebsiella pneumoniae]|nr:hypothetical protein [Klebsiella pneumoniae]
MTDITELAQREKFEAWFKSSFHPDKTGPYIKDQLYFAWKAASAELVEALESEKRICATWRKTAEANSEKLEKAQAENTAGVAGMAESYETTISMLRSRIAELESRTVKLPKPISVLHRREFTAAHCAIYAYPEAEVNAALDDAGIKVEAE